MLIAQFNELVSYSLMERDGSSIQTRLQFAGNLAMFRTPGCCPRLADLDERWVAAIKRNPNREAATGRKICVLSLNVLHLRLLERDKAKAVLNSDVANDSSDSIQRLRLCNNVIGVGHWIAKQCPYARTEHERQERNRNHAHRSNETELSHRWRGQ